MLERALEALARQEVSPGIAWELVVVDNRSDDATPEVLGAWTARGVFPSMRVVREERLGLSHARRAAILAARAEVIAFVDDDCLLDRRWIDVAVRFGRATPSAGAWGGRVKVVWERPPSLVAQQSEWLLALQERGTVATMLPEMQLVGAGLVIRRAALEEWVKHGQLVGRTGRALTSGDDSEISLLVRNAGWELWYEPAMRIEHVIPARRMTYRYLVRLHRAVGRIVPNVAILSGRHRRGLWTRPSFAYTGLAKAADKTLHAVFNLLIGRRSRAVKKWLMANYWFGCFLGSLGVPSPAGGAHPEEKPSAASMATVTSSAVPIAIPAPVPAAAVRHLPQKQDGAPAPP